MLKYARNILYWLIMIGVKLVYELSFFLENYVPSENEESDMEEEKAGRKRIKKGITFN